jgi:hypothetical protein
MAGSPRYKVFHFGNYVAACGSGEIAAAVASMTSEGVVKVDGRIVWREGKEDFSGGESYDGAGDIMRERNRQHRAERLDRRVRK